MLWDIFCKVIDNHGDIGVCWRLASQLGAKGESVRLWVDDASALAWMAPSGRLSVEVKPWSSSAREGAEPGDVVIEAFGCDLEPAFRSALASKPRPPVWINLEYLTAEGFAQRSHGLPSPVLAGPAAGLTKFFFYPGFTPGTGGLLREEDITSRQAGFDSDAWLAATGVEPVPGTRRVSLFSYEPALLPALLREFSTGDAPTHLLVTAGRAAAAAREALRILECGSPGWNAAGRLAIDWLPLLAQRDFDHLLWSCDLNFVRGEDSLVRALWAGKPFIWHIYPQLDNAHHAKLEAFLDWLDAPPALREFHRGWNGMSASLPPLDLFSWKACSDRARTRLWSQTDLASQLTDFALAHRTPP